MNRRGLRQGSKYGQYSKTELMFETGQRVMVTFKKRNGKTFKKLFRTRQTAARAVQGWRNRGGTVISID